jgi:hypothetical protein
LKLENKMKKIRDIDTRGDLAEQRDFEKRRSLYESNGAPTGICAECGKFYEESIDHKGKSVPPESEPYEQHFFAAEPQVAELTSLDGTRLGG